MNRPNILLLFTDQHQFDALHCAGNAKIETPNLDALASSGVRFSQACTPTPICVAARVSCWRPLKTVLARVPRRLPGCSTTTRWRCVVRPRVP